MLRTRLFWFGVGFAVTAASISQFPFKDILLHRYTLFSDVEQKFDALEARILNLESVSSQNSIPSDEVNG